MIVDLLDRSSLLRRRDPGADEQLLAANVDVVAMVFGSDRPLKAGRLFRTRTQIWDAGAVPLVVLTKTDLVEDDSGIEALIGRVHEIDPLLDVVAVSCVTGRASMHYATMSVGGPWRWWASRGRASRRW